VGKVSVRQCDACGQLDSPEIRVKRVTIVSPRFDLCATCRYALLIEWGLDSDRAREIIAAQDAGPAQPEPGEPLPVGVDEEAETDTRAASRRSAAAATPTG
jgi:hypothetical protein